MIWIRSSVAVLLVVALVTALEFGSVRQAIAGGGGCHSSAITDEAGARVEVSGFCYEPTVLRIERGQTVEWTNRDAAPHSVSGANFVWGDFAAIRQDESISFSFDAAGVYPYFCALHPAMIGAVVVGAVDADELATVGGVSSAVAGTPAAAWIAPIVLASLAAGALLGLTRQRPAGDHD